MIEELFVYLIGLQILLHVQIQNARSKRTVELLSAILKEVRADEKEKEKF